MGGMSLGGDALLWLAERATYELMLFAAVGLVLGGLDDMLIDAIWLVRATWRRLAIYSRHVPASAATLAPPEAPGRIAIFVGAWDEAAVIGPMLRAALDRLDHEEYRIFVGVYPNDPATIVAVEAVRATHPRGDRLRLVSGALAGPTTKAEALNRLWAALRDEEVREGRLYKAIVLHDAEDVVHPAELKLFDTLIERFDLVQLPVQPLPDRGSRWVSGHYLDEFAEAHGKQLVVREALGAGMPSAGVGCAIGREALERLAATRGGLPFDAASLTEDYELGLRLGELGCRGVFVRLPAVAGGPLVAVRAYFPASFGAAVRQKTRWITGIALSGWDRLGWRGGLLEGWMRLRDRRAILAHLVVAAGYAAILIGILAVLAQVAAGQPIRLPALPPILLDLTTGLLLWRLAMRGWMVMRFHGWREGLRAVPRTVVSNIIGMAASWGAVRYYARLLGQGVLVWDKTRHRFPADPAVT